MGRGVPLRRLRRCVGVCKVKAHQDTTSTTDPEERRRAEAKGMADEGAKKGAATHAQPSREMTNSLDFFTKRAPLVMKAVGTALALFPPREEKLARKVAPRNAAEAIERKAHEWEFAHGSWRCIWCWKYRRSRMKPKFRAADRCPGPEADDKLLEATKQGHHLLRAEGTLPIIFCGKCGGWSARRRYRLAYKCGVPAAAGER